MSANYSEINKQAWNSRVDAHLQSDFYDVVGFLKGSTSLKEIELKLLGDIQGKTYFTCNVTSVRIPFR